MSNLDKKEKKGRPTNGRSLRAKKPLTSNLQNPLKAKIILLHIFGIMVTSQVKSVLVKWRQELSMNQSFMNSLSLAQEKACSCLFISKQVKPKLYF